MNDPDCTDKSNWLYDEVTPDLIQRHRLNKVLYSGNTRYQKVEIVDTRSFGLCLVLDGKIQSAEKDEFFYHEALVHPAMLTHQQPESIFIAGGGEGATLREVLRHKTVKMAKMIDIDGEVVELCRNYLPSFHQGAFDDARAVIGHEDARKYLEQSQDKFDVMIFDLVDPLEAGPAGLLYTQEFYHTIKQRLNKHGLISVQSGSCGWNNLHVFTAIINTLKQVFLKVFTYQVYIPAFVEPWGFTIASDTANPLTLSTSEIDDRIVNRLSTALKFYEGAAHQSIFYLSKTLRQKIGSTTRIITDSNPVFI